MDVQALLESFGYFVIFASVFIECGVVLGLILPLPGFSLLFAAGVFAASGKMDLAAVIAVGTLAAIAGYIAGYYTGKTYGRKIFYMKETKKYFTERQGAAIETFMKKYGYSALIIGRFLAVVHNVIPIMSGIARTPIVPFMAANVVGGFLWVASSAYLGFYAGQTIPYAEYIAIPIFVGTLILYNIPPVKRYVLRMSKKIGGL